MRTSRSLWLWVWMMCALIGIVAVSGCVPYIEQGEPTIVLDPTLGGPGTSVTVRGSGFPAQTQFSVRLGPPSVGASPLSYGDATTDVEGTFYLSFTMPVRWPDGTPITETDLVVVVLNEDGSTKAIAPFGYTPSLLDASTAVPAPMEPHRQAILVWRRQGDADICAGRNAMACVGRGWVCFRCPLARPWPHILPGGRRQSSAAGA